MPKKRANEDTLGLRGLSPFSDFIAAMDEKHHVTPQELGRGLFAAAASFYREHGFFSFPVRIEPEAFQRSWLAAEGKQAGYEPAGPIKIDHLAMAAAAERAADEEFRRRARPKRPKHSAK